MNEDTSSLPTQDDDISDNGLLDTYVIRITPCDKFTFQQVVEFCETNYTFCNYVVGRETVPREHFHLVVQVDASYPMENVREAVRAFIIPFWQNDDYKLPKGFGNKQYNLQVSTDFHKAVSYAIKLGEYRYGGFTKEFIELRQAESFDKKKPSNFKAEYVELSEKFQTSDMDIRDFMIHYCDLKAKYDQQVNLNHAYGYALSNSIKRDKNASDFVENFLYKQ